MGKFLTVLALTALAGCEEPRLEGYIDAYAPACDNRPYVTAGFDGFTVRCGEYYFERRDDGADLFCRLEKRAEPCTVLWIARGCGEAPGYWSMACLELDEEGNEVSRSSSYSMPATAEQVLEYTGALETIGYEAAEEKYIEWNSQ